MFKSVYAPPSIFYISACSYKYTVEVTQESPNPKIAKIVIDHGVKKKREKL